MEEGLCLCHCKISNSIKENECLLEKAIEAYSDMISKQENHSYSLAENNVCENCRQNGEQMGTRRAKALSFAYNERGQLKYLLVNFDGAVQDYTKAITLHPNAIALYNRGQIYYRMGHFKKAVDDFEEALKHKEDFEDARMGLEASQKALHWL